MKLNMEKFNACKKEKYKKLYMPEVKQSIIMMIVNAIVIFLGIFVAYYMYGVVGISSPFGLVVFVLGVTLASMGFQRLFTCIAELTIQVHNMNGMIPKGMCFAEGSNLVEGLPDNTQGMEVNLVDAGIEIAFCGDVDSNALIPYKYVSNVLADVEEQRIYIFFDWEAAIEDVVVSPVDGIELSEIFEGFDFNTVTAMLVAHVNHKRFSDVSISNEKISKFLWNAVSLNRFLSSLPKMSEEASENTSSVDSEEDVSTVPFEASIDTPKGSEEVASENAENTEVEESSKN